MKTAKFIKKCEWGNGYLYELSEPIGYDGKQTTFVVVSASFTFSGSEVSIFPADEEGNVVDWGELPGSYHSGLSHNKALKNAGFRVIKEAE